jgi:hypothetical protein
MAFSWKDDDSDVADIPTETEPEMIDLLVCDDETIQSLLHASDRLHPDRPSILTAEEANADVALTQARSTKMVQQLKASFVST